ncbi:hypothetical protein ACROYT_G006326 [Oculina patagonica]
MTQNTAQSGFGSSSSTWILSFLLTSCSYILLEEKINAYGLFILKQDKKPYAMKDDISERCRWQKRPWTQANVTNTENENKFH